MENSPRVVATGLGIVTAIGSDVGRVWARTLRGESGIGPLRRFEVGAGQPGTAAEVEDFDIAPRLRSPKNVKFVGKPVACAMLAGLSAAASSELDFTTVDASRISVHTGSGQTGLESSEFFEALKLAWRDREDHDFRYLGGRPSRLIAPYFSLRTLSNVGLAFLSTELKALGPSTNFVQGDTASAFAIAAAYYDLVEGRADVAIVSGYDSLLTVSTYLAYDRAGLLSAAPPDRAYRPFDRDRDGLVLGEGAACLVLERMETARARNAVILGEIVGFGSAMDVADESSPAFWEDTLRAALEEALRGRSVDAVVAHGIGTRGGDREEARLLTTCVPSGVPITAFKGLTGYLGAATGALETVLALLAVRQRVLPPIAHHDRADEGITLDFVVGGPRPIAAESPVAACLARTWTGQTTVVAVSRVSEAER